MKSPFLKKLWRTLISLKFAVVVIALLSAALATATVIESLTDIRTGQYWVYQAWWFKALLATLGILITAVAISRWPWKEKHTPFLLAHLGIITLLVGSYITQKFGVDATLIVDESMSNSRLESQELVLYAAYGNSIGSAEIPWRPPGVGPGIFDRAPSIHLPGQPSVTLSVEDFITHAELKPAFVPAPSADVTDAMAIQVRLEVPAMRFVREAWLYSGGGGFLQTQMGPLAMHILSPRMESALTTPRTVVEFHPQKDGGLVVRALSQKGKKTETRFSAKDLAGDTSKLQIKTPYEGPMGTARLVLKKVIPHALNQSAYEPGRVQYGDGAPLSAIKVVLRGAGSGESVWLGEGEESGFAVGRDRVNLIYGRRTVQLPFGVFLDRFTIHTDPGTQNPASYESRVMIAAGREELQGPFTISMNEPLKWGGFTFYQSSYIPGQPRPTTSVFSVNRDPGRVLKYTGSILIVLGSTLLFAVKWAATLSLRRRAEQALKV